MLARGEVAKRRSGDAGEERCREEEEGGGGHSPPHFLRARGPTSHRDGIKRRDGEEAANEKEGERAWMDVGGCAWATATYFLLMILGNNQDDGLAAACPLSLSDT